MSPDQLPPDETLLRAKLANDPSDWESRRRLAHVLYDRDAFAEAADVIWMADPIPSNDIDLAFAARILAKSQPRKAIRLLAAVLELNRGKAVQNMGMANALLHHGMVLQAARFYGAALEADPTLVNPDLEHFILWTDDEMRLWADFTNRRPKLGELPWMARDPMEALRLTSRVSLHTTPISVPSLPAVPGENLQQDLYQQEAAKNAKITPPPAVTIPIDRVDPKYRRFDDAVGATVVGTDPVSVPAVVEPALPAAKPKLLVAATQPSMAPAATVAAPPVAAAPPVSAPPPVVAPAPVPALAPAPLAPPLDAMQVPIPMAIPLPDHVVPIEAPMATVTPTMPISPPPPSRLPSSLPAPGATIALSKTPLQAPAPTKRLLTPGGKPSLPAKPAVPSPMKPPAGS